LFGFFGGRGRWGGLFIFVFSWGVLVVESRGVSGVVSRRGGGVDVCVMLRINAVAMLVWPGVGNVVGCPLEHEPVVGVGWSGVVHKLWGLVFRVQPDPAIVVQQGTTSMIIVVFFIVHYKFVGGWGKGVQDILFTGALGEGNVSRSSIALRRDLDGVKISKCCVVL